MADYTSISNGLVAVGAKPFATTMQALRDNPIAIAEGAAGAPITRAGWHPYNRTTIGGAETGLIYDSAVDGSVANIVSPDFADGYEYAFVLNNVGVPNTRGLLVAFWRATTGAYSATGTLSTGTSTLTRVYGTMVVSRARETALSHAIALEGGLAGAPADATNPVFSILAPMLLQHGTAQKLLRVRFSLSTGDITVGTIIMLRRLAS